MVLNGKEIAKRMKPGCVREDRIYLLPLGELSIEAASASVDVHLGQEFLSPRRTSGGYLDATGSDGRNIPFRSMGAVGPKAWEDMLDRVCVPISGEFILHPGQFALASVYEFLKLPLDLCADVVGRSSLARVGLIIAMATFVHPGYAGCLTLELQNLGEIPLRLQPGLRVAQIVFRKTAKVSSQPGRQLACSYGPEYWPVVSDKDQELLTKLSMI